MSRTATTILVLLALALPARAALAQGVEFNGTSQYITFGQADSLGARTFTVELWFKRTGAGLTTTTGTGGVTAVPLLTKGRGEAENSNRDMNYFLGIRAADSVLVADYEEGAGQTSPGLNHPVIGATPIMNNVWYHAAVTFDGSAFRLYLNGNLEGTTSGLAGRLPRWDSIQHAALGTAITSSLAAPPTAPAGFFQGAVDEARIWDHARPQQGIRDSALLQLTSGAGLLGRYALDTGSGIIAHNSVGTTNGTLVGGAAWVAGSPFDYSYSGQFLGNAGYVALGDAAAAKLPQFTIETWFLRNGPGATANTGTGGVNAIPLIAKGVGEAEATDVDANYFLGIDGTSGKLVADFEEGAGGATPGLNHPVSGVTTIATGTWYHAAATYDGNKWQLFLNGVFESELVVGQPVRSDSRQHLGLAAALNSSGTRTGSLNGLLDEARVWNSARSLSDIRATINSRLTASTAGLVARWGLDEGAGRVVRDTSGNAVHGTMTPAAPPARWGWGSPAPFNLSFIVPADPSGLTATALSHGQVRLAWVDNSTDETGFELERSTAGIGGPYSLLATLPAGATGHDDIILAGAFEYCYRVRAVGAVGGSGYAGPACATTPAETAAGLDLGGTDGYARVADVAALRLSAFTLEAWIRRDGAGVGTNTGTGGIPDVIPLISKGRADAEDPARDINYIIGIRASDGVLCADFEEGAAGASPSLNHPVAGVTAIGTGTWHHVAATYDGAEWKLYLDGNLETSLIVGQPAGSGSTAAVGLGSALTVAGASSGYFDGVMDEVRIWSGARTELELRDEINAELASPQAGLVARWGLNEDPAGTYVFDTAGGVHTGDILGSNWSWGPGSPFDATIPPPADPSGLTATALSHGQVRLAWVDNSTDETGFEVERSTAGIGGPYSLLATLPVGATGHDDIILTGAFEYCYRVRAVGAFGGSGYAGPACATTPAETAAGLDLGGTDGYARVADVAALRLSAFTLEAWIRRDGAGAGTNTGTGGIPDVIPLISKGRADAEDPARDINYIIGIRASDGVLCADFEEGAAGVSPSLNHPVAGVTAIGTGTWHHVAATYDGAEWKLYLDGNLETSLIVGQPAGSGSTAAVGLGSALTVAGASSGYFDGVMDEVRIWSAARTELELRDEINAELTSPQAGLVGRWGLNEDPAGTYVFDTAGGVHTGSILGSNWSWGPGSPFDAVVTYDISASAGAGGSIAPPGVTPVPHRGNQLYTMTPDAGYHVADVVVDAVPQGPLSAYTFADVIADHTISVTFTINTYTLDVTVVGQGTVTKAPDQVAYDYGTSVELTAAPAVGWSFAGWSGDVTGMTNPSTLVMDGNKAVTATFTINTYTLDVTVVGQGTVTKVPDQLAYDHGTSVELTAAPAVGWSFAGWSGDVTGMTNPSTLVMDGNKAVTGTFTINTYTLDVTVVGQGTVTKAPDQAAYDYGTSVELTAAPAVGWSFAGWSGDVTGMTNPSTLVMDGNKAVTATFTINTYTLDVTVVGQGTVTKVPNQAAYDHGTSVELTAAPAVGWSFAGWSGDVTGMTNPSTLVMDGNKAVTATFTINTYTLDVTVVGQGTVTKVPDQAAYDHGTSVELTAAPAVGWSFAGWSGDVTGMTNPSTLVMDGNKAVTATFTDVTAPTVTLVDPNGGDNLFVDTNEILTWTATDNAGPIATVDLYVSRDNGLTWETIALAAPNTGSYEWLVTGPGTNVDFNPVFTCLFKVEARDAAGNPGQDASDAPFSIFDLVVEVVMARFDAVAGEDGMTVRWELVNPGLFASVELERSQAEVGPWLAVVAERGTEGKATLAVDRAVSAGADYWYRLVARTIAGATVTFGPVRGEGLAREFALEGVSPNPAFGPVRVGFTVAKTSRIRVTVVDVAGREAAVLAEGEYRAGRYQAVWDGVGSNGRVPAGMYFVRYRAAGLDFTKRVVIAR